MERITSLFERAKSGILFGIPTKQKLGKRIEKLSEKEGFKKILVLLEILHGLAKAKDYTILNADGYTFEAEPQDSAKIDKIF